MERAKIVPIFACKAQDGLNNIPFQGGYIIKSIPHLAKIYPHRIKSDADFITVTITFNSACYCGGDRFLWQDSDVAVATSILQVGIYPLLDHPFYHGTATSHI